MTKLVKTGRKPGGGLAPKGGVSKGRGGSDNAKSSQPPRKNSGAWKEEFAEKFKFKTKRAGKAVKERSERKGIPDFLKPQEKGEKLTPKQVGKMLGVVLQPVKAKYGGQGFAKPSYFINGAAPDFKEKLDELFDEHIDGFSGKSFRKMGKKQENAGMLWKQRLKAKAEAEGTIVTGRKKKEKDVVAAVAVDADEGDEKLVAQGGVNWKRKEKAAPEATSDGDVRDVDKSEAPRGASGGLSRKQRTKAAQMGMTPEAYLDWMQRGKVRVTVDTDARNSAIEAYRAMQKAKLQKANPRGRR